MRGRGGGRAPFMPVPKRWRGSTRQVCGLYPWGAPGQLPRVGTPIGFHQDSGETFYFDHINWFDAGFLSNPSVLILARPGLGKSTLANKIVLGLNAQGYIVLIPGDTKPDYTAAVLKLGGEIRAVKRSGGWAFNPCDPGGMIDAARRIRLAADATREAGHHGQAEQFGLAAEELFAEAIARAVTVLAGLLELSRKAPVADYEESVLAAALRHLHTPAFHAPAAGPVAGGGAAVSSPAPVIADLISLIRDRNPVVWQELELERPTDTDDPSAPEIAEYEQLVRPLRRSLRGLIGGRFGDVFARPTTRQPFPCAMDIDTSSIKAGDSRFLAAVLLAAWGDTYAQVEADQALADVGLAERRLYCLILDELWRVMGLGGSLPERVNELTRLNRTQGIGQIMISHSVLDISATSNATTDGIAERAGAIIIGGTTKKEIQRLDDIVTLTWAERRRLRRWWSISQAAMKTPQRDAQGRAIRTPPPGAGKFLIKASSEEPGIPFDVVLTSVERAWGGQQTSARFDREPHTRKEKAA